ncbi:MAG TPA: SRPBCC family protein [Burkholderiales bacterium]|nr:SRPBCC family protein [Burkholderiales bacterium]
MLKKIAIVVAVLVVGVLAFAATRPDTFHVERSASIKAPPEKIFAELNDFKRWNAWSPWENKDPAMKRTFGTTTSGKGAYYGWEGNKDVGKGSMEISESTPPSRLVLQLHFMEPFEAHSAATYVLAPQSGATKITWSMDGPMPYVSKVISIFCDMDAMIGKDFEAGLAKLKTVAEK